MSETGPNAISAAAAVAALPDSLRGYIARTLERTLADCTRCGKCYDACPMPAYSTVLGGAASAAVVACACRHEVRLRPDLEKLVQIR